MQLRQTLSLSPFITEYSYMLDYCIFTALYRIFYVDYKHLLLLRQYVNVQFLMSNIQKRKDKFMNSLLKLPDYKLVLGVAAQCF